MLLCASDPYAAVTLNHILVKQYGVEPDIITGMVVSTSAGSDLVRKMSQKKIPPVSFLTDEGVATMKRLLHSNLSIPSQQHIPIGKENVPKPLLASRD